MSGMIYTVWYFYYILSMVLVLIAKYLAWKYTRILLNRVLLYGLTSIIHTWSIYIYTLLLLGGAIILLVYCLPMPYRWLPSPPCAEPYISPTVDCRSLRPLPPRPPTDGPPALLARPNGGPRTWGAGCQSAIHRQSIGNQSQGICNQEAVTKCYKVIYIYIYITYGGCSQ